MIFFPYPKVSHTFFSDTCCARQQFCVYHRRFSCITRCRVDIGKRPNKKEKFYFVEEKENLLAEKSEKYFQKFSVQSEGNFFLEIFEYFALCSWKEIDQFPQIINQFFTRYHRNLRSLKEIFTEKKILEKFVFIRLSKAKQGEILIQFGVSFEARKRGKKLFFLPGEKLLTTPSLPKKRRKKVLHN